MHKEKTQLRELKILGLSAITNNQDEMTPDKGKIGPLFNQFFSEQIANKFKNRTNPGVIYSIYTKYENKEFGSYTYLVGEEVDSFEDQEEEFTTLTIPAHDYQVFTTEKGTLPHIVINAWQKIWKMSPEDFEGERSYIADFEVYDQRAFDPIEPVVDIYIGVHDKD